MFISHIHSSDKSFETAETAARRATGQVSYLIKVVMQAREAWNDSHDGNKTNSDKKENTGQEYRQIDYKTKQGGARGHKYTQRGKCTGNRRKQDRKLH